MSALVEIRDLLIKRAGREVLEIKRLSIERGEVLAVVGPNGAGKTTLLLVLARLLKPDQGTILFDGEPIESIPSLKYRRTIGLVMQESLLMNCSVTDNVGIGLRFRKLPNSEVIERTNEWLEQLGISHLGKRPANHLSGGEVRRVALARAFVLKPTVLLLDEPFSALDKASRYKLQDDLKGIIAETATTTIFSTHSETDVRKIADRKIEIDGGKLTEVNDGG